MLEFLLSGSVVTTCLVGLFAGLIAYWLMKRWKYTYPPGPPGLPLLGNALQIDYSNLHEQAFKWSKKYGPVITVRIGPVPFVFVNTIDSALEVLVKKSTDFAGRIMTPSLEVMTYGGKDIVFGTYGPTWKLHRKIASKALRHYMQGDALQTRVHDAVETAFMEIDKLSGEFDPTEYVTCIVGNILMGLCFGGKYELKDREVQCLFEKEDRFLEEIGLGPWEDFIPGLRYVYKSKTFEYVESRVAYMYGDFMNKRFKEAQRTFDKDNVRHFTDTLMLARMEAEQEEGKASLLSLSEDHLFQTVGDIFLGKTETFLLNKPQEQRVMICVYEHSEEVRAGVHTTRYTLRNAILHMVAFQDIQEKVQEEIDRVVGRDRLPVMSDRPDLGYTEAALHESMRMVTVAPLGVQHTTLCDTEVCGYRIPKGTFVTVNHWGLHHDPDAWDNVDRFIPERYLDQNGKLGEKPRNWLPFSAGKRVCLGEFVAKPELHLIFACLMQRYKWKMISGKCPDINPVGGLNGMTAKPYKVIVERRI